MALISLHDLRYGFGGTLLLDGIHLQIERGERVALLGRNGCGKSTLLRIIAGELAPDSGEIALEGGCRLAALPQEVPRNLSGTIQEVVQGSIPSMPGENAERLQATAEILSRLSLDPLARVDTLSGGGLRRVGLAQALAKRPDILILDEPTNHLDVSTVLELEELLLRTVRTLLFVTHDRSFLQKISTRILDLDRGKLTSWPGTWNQYQEKKALALEVESAQQAKFDKLVEEEEAWLRRGVKARRTRNEGRVLRLLKLREEQASLRRQTGTVRMRIEQARRSGKLVMEAVDLGFSYGEKPVIRSCSTVISRQDRVGIVGPNGCGKTTLLKLLLGDLEPQQGNVRPGVNLEVRFFDQLRAELDPSVTLRDMVADGSEYLDIGGTRKHVIGYLQDFLFTRNQMDTPVGQLSGGEKNRLLLARLFAKPSNVLVMDEPTNDLDMDTLELLEELLCEYPGTVLIVSHDRTFLDNVVTGTLAFMPDGTVEEFVGGWSDLPLEIRSPSTGQPKKQKKAEPAPSKNRPRRITFGEKRELEGMEASIARMEAERETILQTLSDPDFYRTEAPRAAELNLRLQELETCIDEALERWAHLDELSRL